MLGICLRILSILGILLLILLAFLAAVVFLVLFFPFSYRISGRKDSGGLELTVKGSWLFGLLRAGCRYPEPGHIKVKLLCFTLYDQAIFSEEGQEEKKPAKKKKRKAEKKSRKETAADKPEDSEKENGQPNYEEDGPDRQRDDGNVPGSEQDAGGQAESADGDQESQRQEEKESFLGKITSKIEKIKYTFRNIYDKIKKIRENISYYAELLQKEETKRLLSDSMSAVGKILKSIRPRHIKADIRFGSGSPDTTGYLYGIYCMVFSGRGTGILVVPDFEEAVFEGEFDLSGRIAIWVLLVNGLKMYQLIRKLKAEKK